MISRRRGERIRIGEGDQAIELVVTETHRSSVKLGIVAPRGTLVLRVETAAKPEPEEPA